MNFIRVLLTGMENWCKISFSKIEKYFEQTVGNNFRTNYRSFVPIKLSTVEGEVQVLRYR